MVQQHNFWGDGSSSSYGFLQTVTDLYSCIFTRKWIIASTIQLGFNLWGVMSPVLVIRVKWSMCLSENGLFQHVFQLKSTT